ncbi:MAG: DNA primase [Ruminococcaceae bacterium]|nr:DNA primase [Oscillospiraceae bacterium]
MARFSDEFLSELRMRCDIEQIISSYVQLKRRGKNLVGLCPFHNEKTPSFTVYPESQSYYCFGCGAGGEVINFIRRAENLDYVEAVSYLCDKCSMVLPSDGYDDSIAQKRKRIYEINREAARFFNSCLYTDEGEKGLEYYKMRGYKKSTITKFGLGYAPDKWDSLLKFMRQKGYSYEELHAANLANRSERDGKIRFYDAFRNRVIVPIIDARGNVVAFGGRVLDDSKPKYINSSDTLVYKKSLGVFGLNFAKNSKENSLILVEGYMDAISLHQAGFDNVIACLGTALTSEMAHLLSRYCDEIILSYDADEAGQKATARAIDIFNSIGMKLRIVHLSGGKDPDEILRNYGPERFRSLIEGAANDIEFALVRLRNDYDLATSDGKMKFLEKASEVLAGTRNRIAQDIYSSRLADELSVSKQSILIRIDQLSRRSAVTQERKQFRDIQQRSVSENSKAALANDTDIRSIKAQQMLIATLMKSPELLRSMGDGISEEDFSVPLYARLFSVIKEKILESRNLELTFFSQELAPDEMDELVSIVRKHEHLSFSLTTCADCVRAIREGQQKKGEKVSLTDISDEEFLRLFKK